jgi:hypothetical protein
MTGNEDIPINNGAVLNILQIIRAVMSLAAEAKLGALFINSKNGSLHATLSQRNGTSTNSHPHTNRQFNCPHTTHTQNYGQSIEGHGHEIPLVALPQSTGPVSFLLETWNTKFGGLLDQASCSQPPQSFLATNTNLFKEHGNQIFLQENLINTGICGTNGSTTMNNCSQRHLMAQRQGCVRLTGRTY